MRELFVYYRVRSADAVELRAAVDRMQAALRERHQGLCARVLRRADPVMSSETWMETYAMAADDPAVNRSGGIDVALEADIGAAAEPLLTLIDGPRHTEAFDA